MCYFVSSHHNCGHLHESFARCYFAQRDDNYACNKQSFPIWPHPDPFPCPECRAHRKAETQELLSPRGNKVSDATRIKAEPLQQSNTESHLSRQPIGYNIQPNPQVAGEYANIAAQLQTLASEALQTSPLPNMPRQLPWVPPSRRHASIVGQLGSSPQSQVHGTTPSQSPDMLSVGESSQPDSAMAPVYPDQVQSASPQLAWLLRETES